MTNYIPDRPFEPSEPKLHVKYYPMKNDGSLGHIQSIYLPWTGPLGLDDAELIIEAKDFLAEKYEPCRDKVVSARLCVRYELDREEFLAAHGRG